MVFNNECRMFFDISRFFLYIFLIILRVMVIYDIEDLLLVKYKEYRKWKLKLIEVCKYFIRVIKMINEFFIG